MACGCSHKKRSLKGKQKNLPKHLQEKILSVPVKRLKYCSGKSKPFKKLKKY